MTWPDNRHAAISVTFDNLGEAAELQMGLHGDDYQPGGHHSVVTCLPMVLRDLAGADLRATFFVEGINAELYPDELRGISDAGHEVAFHAWQHEEWSALSREDEAANLDRGVAALRSLGLPVAGFRPPGGRLGDVTLELLRDRGLKYCSPAGSTAGVDSVVVLPFAWPDVDAFHILPTFEGLREHVTGNGEGGGPEVVLETLTGAVDRVLADGGHLALVLHTWLIEAEREAVTDILERVSEAGRSGDAWVARCDEVAEWIAAHPDDFAAEPELDDVSWADPG